MEYRRQALSFCFAPSVAAAVRIFDSFLFEVFHEILIYSIVRTDAPKLAGFTYRRVFAAVFRLCITSALFPSVWHKTRDCASSKLDFSGLFGPGGQNGVARRKNAAK